MCYINLHFTYLLTYSENDKLFLHFATGDK